MEVFECDTLTVERIRVELCCALRVIVVIAESVDAQPVNAWIEPEQVHADRLLGHARKVVRIVVVNVVRAERRVLVEAKCCSVACFELDVLALVENALQEVLRGRCKLTLSAGMEKKFRAHSSCLVYGCEHGSTGCLACGDSVLGKARQDPGKVAECAFEVVIEAGRIDAPFWG